VSPDRRWAVAGALLLALALVPFATSGVLNNDELTSPSHAQRMLAGEWPYRDFFEFLPPATRYSLMLPPDLGYGSPEEFRAFWAEIAGRRPRFIVIAPWAWKPFELAVRDYADHLPPGYRKVATLESPQYRRVFPGLRARRLG
jgi:hypothetical protein